MLIRREIQSLVYFSNMKSIYFLYTGAISQCWFLVLPSDPNFWETTWPWCQESSAVWATSTVFFLFLFFKYLDLSKMNIHVIHFISFMTCVLCFIRWIFQMLLKLQMFFFSCLLCIKKMQKWSKLFLRFLVQNKCFIPKWNLFLLWKYLWVIIPLLCKTDALLKKALSSLQFQTYSFTTSLLLKLGLLKVLLKIIWLWWVFVALILSIRLIMYKHGSTSHTFISGWKESQESVRLAWSPTYSEALCRAGLLPCGSGQCSRSVCVPVSFQNYCYKFILS